MKKSKILLTLVVVLLLCSMLFALVACNNNEKEPEKPVEPQKPEEPEDNSSEIIAEAQGYITSAFQFEKTAAMQYAVEIPVADTEDGKSRTILLEVKACLDPVTSNNNFFEIKADEKIAEDIKNVFVLVADEKDVYLTAGEVKKVFPGLNMGDLMKDAVLPASNDVKSTLDGVLGMVFGMLFDKAEVAGNVYTIHGNLSTIATVLSELVGGFIPEEATEYIGGTVEGLKADLVKLISGIKPTIVMTVDNGVITKFDLNIDTQWGPAHVYIAPKFATAIEGLKADVPTAAEKANYKATQVLNFELAGKFEMAEVYDYSIKADVDLFCIIKNLVKNDAVNHPENLFKGTQTKLFADVKTAGNSIINVVVDPKVGEEIVCLVDTKAALPAAFVDFLFAADKATELKNEGFKKYAFNYATEIKKFIDDKAADDKANAEANKGKVAGPELSAEEPTAKAYKTGMAGKVYWTAAENTTYKVTVAGVAVDPTLSTDKKTYSVAATSGQVVSVIAVKDAKESLASTKTYIDGRATAKAVASAVSMLTAIDFNYDTYSVIVNTALVKNFIKDLDVATDINIKGVSESKDLSGVIAYFDAVLGDEIKINVSDKSGFYTFESADFEPAALAKAATGVDLLAK